MALNPLDPTAWLKPESAPDDPRFWREWLQQAAPALGATCAMIIRPAGGDQPQRTLLRAGEQMREIPDGLIAAVLAGEPLQTAAHELGGGHFAVRLPWDGTGDDPVVAVGEVPAAAWPTESAPAWRDRVLLWATAAGRRRRIRELVTTKRRADELAHALELAVLVRAQKTFRAAALEACNQLANRHGADRVVLGWWREPYIKVVAVSQMNQVETNMTAVVAVEAAMEEAVEQDTALVWPLAEVEGEAMPAEIVAQHAGLGREQGWANLCTVPLRAGDRVVGAVTWHRQGGEPFTPDDAEGFALGLDALTPVLVEKERRQGWWGRRLKRSAEEAVRRHWNLHHPWPKLAAVIAATVLAAMILIRVPYRVEAEFALRPVHQMVFSAPFDGFVHEVDVAPGDFVAVGGALFALDGTALRLEEAELLADLSRYAREREQAEAARELAAMRVAEAQRDQIEARLQRLRRQISQTEAVAPFAGYVLDDGNLSERLGAPVRQGDALMRFAQLDGMFYELVVPEADTPLVAEGTTVEIAFRSRPDEVFTATVIAIEPEAVVRPEGAMFLVRAAPDAALPEGWRPGMTGIGKLITEKRTLLDIFTRRLRDWLHLQLWW